MRSQEIFPTIRTEGGLLPADLLEKIAAGDNSIKGLDPSDYHLVAGERLNESISRSWSRLLPAWKSFKLAAEKLPHAEPGTSVTREKWLLPLFQELGYGRLTLSKAIEIDKHSYPVSHFWQHAPIHLVGCNVELDKRTASVAGAARTSPHSLVQELLNRSNASLWGFVSNGLVLRILRDNKSLTRQAYVEFDIQGMMDAEVFSDFALLWLLCHQSRVESEKPESCWLEKWMVTAQQQGSRALDHLRDGVERAIKSFGEGFLSHPNNSTLREKLRLGNVSTQDYYRQLLRLVYRLLFLFVAEDRELLLNPKSDLTVRERFFKYYSTARLRKLAHRHIGTRHSDLYCSLRIVMEKLSSEEGSPELGLPPLDSFLWSFEAIPDLGVAELSNRDFLEAIRVLAFNEDRGMLRPIDYKNLGSEELGSVYESLLELHPEIESGGQTFDLEVAAGHERKTTGSYYTPSSLIQCLLDSALDPVLNDARKTANPEKAILNLKVCDPACGSGHFLVAAAHRMAKTLASIRTGDEEPAPEAIRTAIRDVIGHCIYGVDINPMSVELCKVSLWMEALEPGKPLSFLDHHIQRGNSLIGATPSLLQKGIPDAVFTPIEGDDKAFCSKLKKRNKKEREGHQNLFDKSGEPWDRLGNLAAEMMNLDQISDDSIEGIRKKEEQYQKLVKSSGYEFSRLWADAWCAAFVWKKTPDQPFDAITEDIFRMIERNPYSVSPKMREEIRRLADEYKFFHWHLAFPNVFHQLTKEEKNDNPAAGWAGGFDVVLGNPPWERIKIQEKEWFAKCRPEIASAPNAAARRKRIIALKTEDPVLYRAFLDDQRKAEGESIAVRESGRYPLCGRGDVNTYSIFAELDRQIINSNGRVGCIVPSGIAIDDTTKFFFQNLIESKCLSSLYSFENEEFIFPAVHHATKFCLLTMSGVDKRTLNPDFLFFARQTSDLSDTERHFTLTAEDISLLNPNTRTCPIFRTKKDAEITKVIYRRVPVLIKEDPPVENPWGISFMRMFDMASDSNLFRVRQQLESEGWILQGNVFFRSGERYLPLYEAKMIHQFDHRFGTYEGQTEAQANQGKLPELNDNQHADPTFFTLPRYCVSSKEVDERLGTSWPYDWLIGWRDVTSAVTKRTVVATLIPRVGVGHKFPLMFPKNIEPKLICCLLANFNSLCFDYVARQKLGGTSLTYFFLKQFPVLPPAIFGQSCGFTGNDLLKNWITERVLQLVCTSIDVTTFSRDCGYTDEVSQWDARRRLLIRCELDAAIFHAYGINREDMDYIMETFPIVKRNDIQIYSEYRTKRVILECYDAMKKAIQTSHPYQTILDPPPAGLRSTHSAKSEA